MEKLCRAIYDYTGTTDEEMSFSIGDRFTVLDMGAVDWWYVQQCDSSKETGYVPSSYVEMLEHDAEKDHIASEQPKAYQEISADLHQKQVNELYHTKQDSVSESSTGSYTNSNTYSDSDDESSEDQNSKRDDAVNNIIAQQRISRKQSRALLHQQKRRLVGPGLPLKTIGQLPYGLCYSALSEAYNAGQGNIEEFLSPELNPSGIDFVDLHLDRKNKLREISSTLSIAFSILDAKHIRDKQIQFPICGRQVRMALVDKSSILSNIHTVSAYMPESEQAWRFSSKASLLFPKDDENTCFLRANNIEISVCLLFELCVMIRNPKQKQDSKEDKAFVEVSLGWGLLPLFSADGPLIENKTYEINLHKGNPFQKSNEIDEPLAKRGFLQGLMFQHQLPQIHIRLLKLSKNMVKKLNHLPTVIVGQLSLCTIFSLYRQIQARVLSTTIRENCGHIDAIYEPVLGIFPKILRQPDILQAVALAWNQHFKLLASAERRSLSKILERFGYCVLDFWTAVSFKELSEYNIGDYNALKTRGSYIKKLQDCVSAKYLKGNVSELSFRPFNIDELIFSA
ncbi:hypothetical protein QVD99_004154 [Batrachochytrium dendrobatidis]|nr:hypothetical protein QVD99_004154 [Batrachochytrium dendrobatidis]